MAILESYCNFLMIFLIHNKHEYGWVNAAYLTQTEHLISYNVAD